MRFDWSTPGIEDRLRALWINERKSSAEVAAALSSEFHVTVNRVMVLGVIRRMGIGPQGGAIDPLRGLKHAGQGEGAHRRAAAKATAPADTIISEPTIVAAEINAAPARPGIPLLDLKARSCRFPVTPFGARVHLFCGDPTTDEKSSWCAEHRKVVFTDRKTEQFIPRRGAAA